MCDTVCSVQPGRTLFAKNSDRPITEVQLIEGFAPRAAGGVVRTQYLELFDEGAVGVVGARPDWLWGFEHGVNQHGVAIGNEKVWTVDDASAAPAALIGMDLVRLGLERASSADDALTIITGLLDEHGQGGIADAADDEAYFSSFLIADGHGGWVLETSARSWAARPVGNGTAISNRISIGHDWQQSSDDVAEGTDWDQFRDPQAWTGLADVRLAVTRPVVEGPAQPSPREMAGLLRDHGGRSGLPSPDIAADGTGITVCMHVRDYQCTTSSIIALLEPDRPPRAWVAMGSPCVSLYLPIFGAGDGTVPDALSRPATFARFTRLRQRVEAAPWDRSRSDASLAEIRKVLDPIEDELWSEADAIADQPERHSPFVHQAWRRVDDALTKLDV
jgi:secernin